MPVILLLLLLSIILITLIVMWVINQVITINKVVNNQFKLPRTGAKHHSPDRAIEPKFEHQSELPSDISQLYFYQDCVWRNTLTSIPGEITHKIHYRKNSKSDPPICISVNINNCTYILIRSTKTLQEKLKDIDVAQTNESHKGIRDIYNSINNDIINIITQYDKIVIFGHSLGGAIVDLLSYDLMNKHPNLWNKCKAISSGSPRVFSPCKSDSFSYHQSINNYTKIINEADVVPFHPSTATGVDGILSTGKKFFYKSFSNKRRIYRFNYVVETQALDSHMSSTYSNAIWNTSSYELPSFINRHKVV
jgi:hypothetical protein